MAGKRDATDVAWLFFSLDIVGSTAFKVRSADWHRLTLKFYTLTMDIMGTNWAQESAKLEERLHAKKYPDATRIGRRHTVAQPTLWKTLGDEIIFVQELSLGDHFEIVRSMTSFGRTVRECQDVMREISAGHLSVKGTAWLASATDNYAYEVDFPEFLPIALGRIGRVKTRQLEFIGPDIDLGFRIAKYATERKIVLSIETARSLAEAILHLDGIKAESVAMFPWNIVYEDGDELKGIFRAGIPYPKIQVTLRPEAGKRNHLALTTRHVSAEELRAVCREWVRSHPYRLFQRR